MCFFVASRLCICGHAIRMEYNGRRKSLTCLDRGSDDALDCGEIILFREIFCGEPTAWSPFRLMAGDDYVNSEFTIEVLAGFALLGSSGLITAERSFSAFTTSVVGGSGWSSLVVRLNLAAKLKFDPFPRIAMPSI